MQRLPARPMWAHALLRSFVGMFKHSTAQGAPMIVVDGLTERYGQTTVVDALSFQVRAGRVTGFLGPNGAGKTQTIKMILGLVRASAGRATIAGRPLTAHDDPARVAGCVLDGGAFSPGRRARSALRIAARVAGIPSSRVDELIELVGLGGDAHRKLGDFSLGMRQRLALAQGLLADPAVLIADEPANGLDPAGISWLRGLLRELAGRGTTVLLSSHLLSEAERLVDDVIVIAGGRLLNHGSLDELRASDRQEVLVEAADRAALAAKLRARGMTVTTNGGGPIRVSGDVATVGQIAAQAGIRLLKLDQTEEGLEELFLKLTTVASEEDR